MAIAKVKNIGQYGIMQDLSEHELPINAWTDALNVRFLDGYAHQAGGYGQVYDTPSVIPYHVLPIIISGARYWIYASLAKIYCCTVTGGSAVHTNLTRQTAGNDVDYAATANSWTSTVLGGIPILNPGNTADPPQQWDLNTANNFAALSNWPASTYCKSMRAYKNFLVALNVTKSTTNYPYMVKWSHPADPGSVPSSWDITDATKDAGELDLSEGYDHIVDGLGLGDALIIYKESSVWRLDYVGGQFVQRASRVRGTSGAMNRNCIAEIDGYHIVLTTNDIIAHDGFNASSVLDKYTRRWLFANIDVDGQGLCFVFKNPFYNEVFICFPKIGSDYCDMAIVYNYVDRTVSKRTLPNVHHAAYGSIDTTLTASIDSDSAPIDSDISLIDGGEAVPSVARVIMGSNAQELYMLDSSTSADGALPEWYLERRGISLEMPEQIKLVQGIRPRITGNTGYDVTVSVGAQDDPYADPNYTDMTHTVGETVRNNCLVSGRYFAVKYSGESAYQSRLDSYDIEYETLGEW